MIKVSKLGSIIDWEFIHNLSTFFRVFFFFGLWIAGAAATILLLKSKKTAPVRKYSLITFIGVLYIAIIIIRTSTISDRDVIRFDQYRHAWFGASEEERTDFKDADHRKMNFKSLLKKKQLSILKTTDTPTVKRELARVATEEEMNVFDIDLDRVFSSIFRKKSSERFWSMFAITLIKKITSLGDSSSTIFAKWSPKQYYHDQIPHFFEVLETAARGLPNFNVIIMTDNDELLKNMKTNSISDITSVFRLTEMTRRKVMTAYRENKVTGFEQEKLLDKEEIEDYE